jgi:hypothetical protein
MKKPKGVIREQLKVSKLQLVQCDEVEETTTQGGEFKKKTSSMSISQAD